MRIFTLPAVTDHDKYMQRCLQIARAGQGRVAPNPMVGAVLVHRDRIVGEGFHRAFGGPHAEVNAIRSVRNRDLLPESTLYVNLEPCAHVGKTPPCADLIIASGIPKVVVAQVDPNPVVGGKGILKLRQAGVDVTTGVFEEDALFLNRRFNTYHSQKRPYIILKWAQTANGFMDRSRDDFQTGINWISHPFTKKMVHKWRSEEEAIIVGAGTIRNDDPELTVRGWFGKSPMRVALSQKGELPQSSAIFGDSQPIWIINNVHEKISGKEEWMMGKNNETLPETAARVLYERGLTSVLVEGGAQTLQSFIEAGLWDEARVIVSDATFRSGLNAPLLSVNATSRQNYGRDQIFQYFRI